MSLRVFMVAGEASADLHGAALLRELKKIYPDLKCFGVGGESLAQEGMEILVPSHRLNVVGISDWFDRLFDVVGAYQGIVRAIQRRDPHVAILLDLPDFNFRLAAHLKRLRVPVAYYISPQVWAWRRYRLRKIRKYIDRMLVLFPFEKEFYDKHGVSAEFVGHPLLESLEARTRYRLQKEVEASPRIALLPGSRKSELRFHAPILREAVAKIREQFPTAEIRVPVASTLSLDEVKIAFQDARVELVLGNSRAVLAWADVALVASGTATLETALLGTPFCLFYRVSASSAWIFRKLVRYPGYIGLPNLLHKREVVREFFQEKANAKNLAEECTRLIKDENYRLAMAQALIQCRTLLGNPGASVRAAHAIQHLIEKRDYAGLGFALTKATT